MDVDEDLVILSSGGFQLALAPNVGGCIARFDRLTNGKTIPILRGTAACPEQGLDAASFPLVPYCNRIRNGAFRFRGREIRLAPNMANDPSPLHGQGWLSRWEVARRSEAEGVLVFHHSAGEWPWSYQARQHFRLSERGLEVVLACTNASPEPMPCGLGQHPYFPCTPETRLSTEVDCVWTIDDETLPVAKVPAEGRYDLRDRLVCGQDLDNGFGGWGGHALITTPALPFAVEMSSPAAGYFQLYSPASGGFIVAEPVSHANAALNAPEERWAGLGLHVLDPGETMILSMRIGVTPGETCT